MKLRTCFTFLFAIILLSFIPVYGAQFGAPEHLAKDGSFSLGVGYSYFSNEYRIQSSSEDFEIKQNQIYAQINVAYRFFEILRESGGRGSKD